MPKIEINATLADILSAVFHEDNADEVIDRLGRLAEDAIATLGEPTGGTLKGVFSANDPDYSADMPTYGHGTVMSRAALATMEEWVEGDDDAREAVDRRLAKLERDTIRLRDENAQRDY